MNCANHPDRERVAFCQNCGKPLCTECVRNVGTSIFCEPCLTARVAANAPRGNYGRTAPGGYPPPGPTGYPPPNPTGYPPAGPPLTQSEPNPGLAALLGFIPGVGAMYNEQYAKGLVHLMVFAVIVSLAHDVGIFWLFAWGWIFYMVIEAHHTARARRDGTPLPNPFGLNDLSERLGFGRSWPGSANAYGAATNPDPAAQPGGPAVAQDPAASYAPPPNPYASPYSSPFVPPASHWGAPQYPPVPPIPPVPPVPPIPPYPDNSAPYYRRIPTGAIWLILLGVLFLFGGTFHIIHGMFFGPILVIGVGVWLFVQKMLSSGQGFEDDGTPMYHWRLVRAVRSSFWVILVGILWLLDTLHILSWSRSWPLFLIVGGAMMFFRRAFYPGYGYGYMPPAGTPPTPPAATGTALVPSDPRIQPRAGDQEGR